jgi:hypothetical protein
MTLKHGIIIFLLFFIRFSVFGQVNYLSVDYSAFELKHKYNDTASSVPSGKMIRFNGTYIGESFHLALGRYNSLSLGLGLTTINYEKQWLGVFRENNQFGAATLKGKIQYLSLPLSLTLITGTGLKRYRSSYRNPFRFGINIRYVPSFQTGNSFAMNTYAAADSSSFFSGYHPGTREFQHSLTIGFCNQLLLFNKKDKKLLVTVEPYIGYGSGFFYVKGGSSAFTYGIKFQLGIHLKLPRIRIEREVNPGNAAEKKKLLEQKQKEIEQQLNKQP